MQTMHRLSIGFSAVTAFGFWTAAPSTAQTLDPFYAGQYQTSNIAVSGISGLLGGLTLKQGDPNTLLLSVNADDPTGAIYSYTVTRNGSGHITAISTTPNVFATAPDIDSGLTYGPGNVLFYTAYPDNQVGEIKTGSSVPNKIVTLSPQIQPSVGSMTFVPTGFGGSGTLKIISYSASTIYTTPFTSDGLGTFNLGTPTSSINVGGGAAGLTYIASSNPDFVASSVLVTEGALSDIVSYTIDGNGDPILGSKKTFLTGLGLPASGLLDPVTGDFLFSDIDHLVQVRGFVVPAVAPTVPEVSPSLVLPLGLSGIIGLIMLRRKHKLPRNA